MTIAITILASTTFALAFALVLTLRALDRERADLVNTRTLIETHDLPSTE